jgi:hypothetical protein
MFRNGQLCVYELMDEDSAVRYWEGYGKIAFDAGMSLLPFLTLPLLLLLLFRLALNHITHPDNSTLSEQGR